MLPTSDDRYTVHEWLKLTNELGYHIRKNPPPPKILTWSDVGKDFVRFMTLFVGIALMAIIFIEGIIYLELQP